MLKYRVCPGELKDCWKTIQINGNAKHVVNVVVLGIVNDGFSTPFHFYKWDMAVGIN